LRALFESTITTFDPGIYARFGDNVMVVSPPSTGVGLSVPVDVAR
jgi:hypothetical protein